uniref:site-specific integrase n=1 Tax=Pseudonocardia pini TaxID=2758030 RepID=UPI0015F00951
MSVSQAVEAFLAHLAVERGSSANTLRAYGNDLDRYRGYLDERGIAELGAVRETDVGEFVAALRSGPTPLAASSAARALAAVRGLHRFATRDGQIPVDVARGVTAPTLRSTLPSTLTVDQVDQLLAGCVGEGPGDLRDRALLEVLYSTGARISEAVGLDLDDLDTGDRTVLLRGKGGKQRIVPIGR